MATETYNADWLSDRRANRREALLLGGAAAIAAVVGNTLTNFVIGSITADKQPRLLNVSYSERPDAISLPTVSFRGDPTAAGRPMREWGHVAVVGMSREDKEMAKAAGWLPAAIFLAPAKVSRQGVAIVHATNLGSWDNVNQVGRDPATVGVGFLLGGGGLQAGIAAISTSGNLGAPWELRDLGIHTLDDMARNLSNVGIA